jgi:hypothetical protein
MLAFFPRGVVESLALSFERYIATPRWMLRGASVAM